MITKGGRQEPIRAENAVRKVSSIVQTIEEDRSKRFAILDRLFSGRVAREERKLPERYI